MSIDSGRTEDSYHYQTIQDHVNRTLSSKIPLPLAQVNVKGIPCVTYNRTPDVFGTKDDDWSDEEEDDESVDDSVSSTAWEDKE